ncbi:MAG: nuclear transport factor 2 family protein [Gammaproteobacteria bacterium]|nr:nuclear transport factor 2 family protein [Gammaproteobacteria bacterium]
MTEQTPTAVFNAYLDAFAARDFDRMRATLSDATFYYRGPVATHTDATEFVMDISRIGQILDGIDVRRLFVDGNEICAILDFRIRINIVDITRVVLWVIVENGKIVSIEAFFDATEYSQMFPEREG